MNDNQSAADTLRAWADRQDEPNGQKAELARLIAEQIEVAESAPESKAVREIIRDNIERLKKL